MKSEGKPGNGSPKPDESRMQALYPKGIYVGHIEPRKIKFLAYKMRKPRPSYEPVKEHKSRKVNKVSGLDS